MTNFVVVILSLLIALSLAAAVMLLAGVVVRFSPGGGSFGVALHSGASKLLEWLYKGFTSLLVAILMLFTVLITSLTDFYNWSRRK